MLDTRQLAALLTVFTGNARLLYASGDNDAKRLSRLLMALLRNFGN